VEYSVDGQKWRRTRSQDVSTTGMLLLSEEPVTPGQNVLVQFNLPHTKYQDPISAETEVMRVIYRQGRQSGFGLRFINLRAGSYHQVEEFVSRILGLPLSNTTAAGRQSEAGYTISMERLAEEAAGRDDSVEGRRVSLSGPSVYDRTRQFVRYGVWVVLILAALWIGYEVVHEAAAFFLKNR
jgi:hypothetical protein